MGKLRLTCASKMTSSGSMDTIMDAHAFARALERMAGEIGALADPGELVLVGIQRRGVELADRLASLISKSGTEIPRGALDITLYRDDLETIGPKPFVGETNIPCNLDSKSVVIVDDVLYTGRTVRAALNELADFGRPSKVSLCVLIDRGGRELPIQADIVGERISVGKNDRVDVLVCELDGKDGVELVAEGEG